MSSQDYEHRETSFITGACRPARVVAAGAVSDSAGSSSILYSCLRSPLAPPCQAFCTACSVPVAINYAGTEMTRHHQRDPRLEQGPAPPLWKPWWPFGRALIICLTWCRSGIKKLALGCQSQPERASPWSAPEVIITRSVSIPWRVRRRRFRTEQGCRPIKNLYIHTVLYGVLGSWSSSIVQRSLLPATCRHRIGD